jgi:hypothetical protein
VTSILSQFAPLLDLLPLQLVVIVMLVISLVLIFAGRRVIKVFAFFVVGIIGASIGGMLGAQYLSSLGNVGTLLGALLGFFIGGLIGIVLIAVGIGLVVGYGAYLLTLELVSGTTIPVVVGVVFFLLGVVLYNKILPLVTAAAGGFLLYVALVLYSISPTVSAILAALAALVGIWVNLRHGRSRRRRGF